MRFGRAECSMTARQLGSPALGLPSALPRGLAASGLAPGKAERLSSSSRSTRANCPSEAVSHSSAEQWWPSRFATAAAEAAPATACVANAGCLARRSAASSAASRSAGCTRAQARDRGVLQPRGGMPPALRVLATAINVNSPAAAARPALGGVSHAAQGRIAWPLADSSCASPPRSFRRRAAALAVAAPDGGLASPTPSAPSDPMRSRPGRAPA
mmetsp:Transcript_2226/g.8574  ORF Transcript_2226/g.8574 Transcript_2226/m.8574 type:complete len:214 (-) Transcript_2226:3418-4059(-)